MLRIETAPRPDWTKIVESQGLLFHSIDGEPYWDESAYYLFEAEEVDADRGGHVPARRDVPGGRRARRSRAAGSTNSASPSRSTASSPGAGSATSTRSTAGSTCPSTATGPPKLLEYNADTPTALLEAAVIQWFWFQDLLALARRRSTEPQFDQFNSIHERLIEAWGRVRRELGERVTFAAIAGVARGRDDGRLPPRHGHPGRAARPSSSPSRRSAGTPAAGVFTDLRERPIELLFKLYPWEWMLREPFGRYLPTAPTRWLEPPWKMVLSNKAILPVLCELFPDSPYLLRAEFEPFGDTYVVEADPLARGGERHDRRGRPDRSPRPAATTRRPARSTRSTARCPSFDGRYPVVGSWIVNGHACGMGIREDDGLITRNTSRFLPHLFRKSPTPSRP